MHLTVPSSADSENAEATQVQGGSTANSALLLTILHARQAVSPTASANADASVLMSGSAPLGLHGAFNSNQQLAENIDMDDKDVRRLEDRIVASEEKAQLRLELVTGRIEGTLARIADQTTAIRGELQEQRADARSLRAELGQQSSEQRAAQRAHFYWVIGTIIFSALAIAALISSVGQFWAAGVQVGQSLPHISQSNPQTQAPAKP